MHARVVYVYCTCSIVYISLSFPHHYGVIELQLEPSSILIPTQIVDFTVEFLLSIFSMQQFVHEPLLSPFIPPYSITSRSSQARVASAMAVFRRIMVDDARQDIGIWDTMKSCTFSSGNIYSVQCVRKPFLSPSSILIPAPSAATSCCHGLIMQNHGPWCKEEEKGSLVKNQSEFMHLWPWMGILTTGGAKRDENYTLACYYVRERSIHISIFIWFCFIDHM